MDTNTTNEAVILSTDNTHSPDAPATVEITPLTPASLSHFDPQTQANVLALSTQIDVLDLERIMSYGQIPLITSFEQAGKILQNAQGTTADQEVVKEVIELTKQANDTYDEFNLILKEPSLIQRILLKISTATKEKQDSEVSIRAVTSYKLLEQLSKSCEKWLTMLKDGRTEIFQRVFRGCVFYAHLRKYTPYKLVRHHFRIPGTDNFCNSAE